MKAASGIFMWLREERVTSRYGMFYAGEQNYDGNVTREVTVDIDALRKLEGRRVQVTVRVIESRKSGHCGDLFLQIFPSQPGEGETLDLGVGDLAVERASEGDTLIGIRPGDGRKTFWCDPRKLYRLHDQTVEIHVEETVDDYSPRPDVQSLEKSGAIGTGDGVQFRNVPDEDLHQVVPPEPEFERIGDGVFVMRTRQPGFGERLRIDPTRRRK